MRHMWIHLGLFTRRLREDQRRNGQQKAREMARNHRMSQDDNVILCILTKCNLLTAWVHTTVESAEKLLRAWFT
jgi:hypothetical protein